MIPKTIGQSIMSEKYAETLKQSVKKVIDSSINPDSGFPGTCSLELDRPITILLRPTPRCEKYEEYNSSIAALKNAMGKWNKIFTEWGLPMKLVEEDGASISIRTGCLWGSDENIRAATARAIPMHLGLACPPMTPDIAPSVRRTLGLIPEGNGIYSLSSFPHGEWMPANCYVEGSSFLPGPTDIGALAWGCNLDGNKTHFSQISGKLIEQYTEKYGNNVIGHFLGGFIADVTRRILELSMTRTGVFKDREWLLKAIPELVAVLVQVAIMAHFGSYTAAGGAAVALWGLAAGIVGDTFLPGSIRAPLWALGYVNMAFALIDYFGGSGNAGSEILASLLGHLSAQLGLNGMEALLQKCFPKNDLTELEMLAKNEFSVWANADSVTCHDPLAPWNKPGPFPHCAYLLRRGNAIMAHLIQSCFSLTVLRRRIYKSDADADLQRLNEAFRQAHRLIDVMTRVELEPEPSKLTPDGLLDLLEEKKAHFSFNCHVTDIRPGLDLWNLLIKRLGTHNNSIQPIETLDLRGLKMENDHNEMESPYTGKAWDVDLSEFSHLKVLALDAMPIIFNKPITFLPLEALRLTMPAGMSGTAAGVPADKLTKMLGHLTSLTQLTADVCTDPAIYEKGKNKNARKSMYKALRALYEFIITAKSLQKVDLRIELAVVEASFKWLRKLDEKLEFPPDWLQKIARTLESNYLLYEFRPLEDISKRIKGIILRNIELQTDLLNVASDPAKVDEILLARVPDAAMRERLKKLVVDPANRAANASSTSPMEAEEEVEVVEESGDEEKVEVVEESGDKEKRKAVEGSDDDTVIPIGSLLSRDYDPDYALNYDPV